MAFVWWVPSSWVLEHWPELSPRARLLVWLSYLLLFSGTLCLSYLVLHGDTGSKSPVAAFAPSVLVNDCAARPARSNQLTAILQPDAG